MLLRTIVFFVAVTLLHSPALAADDPEQAVRPRLEQLVRAFNERDVEAVKRLVHPEPDVINPLGQRVRDREKIVEIFRDDRAGPTGETRFEVLGDAEVRVLSETVVATTSRVEVKGARSLEGKPVPPARAWVTIIWTPQDGEWRLTMARAIFERSGAQPRF